MNEDLEFCGGNCHRPPTQPNHSSTQCRSAATWAHIYGTISICNMVELYLNHSVCLQTYAGQVLLWSHGRHKIMTEFNARCRDGRDLTGGRWDRVDERHGGGLAVISLGNCCWKTSAVSPAIQLCRLTEGGGGTALLQCSMLSDPRPTCSSVCGVGVGCDWGSRKVPASEKNQWPVIGLPAGLPWELRCQARYHLIRPLTLTQDGLQLWEIDRTRHCVRKGRMKQHSRIFMISMTQSIGFSRENWLNSSCCRPIRPALGICTISDFR